MQTPRNFSFVPKAFDEFPIYAPSVKLSLDHTPSGLLELGRRKRLCPCLGRADAAAVDEFVAVGVASGGSQVACRYDVSRDRHFGTLFVVDLQRLLFLHLLRCKE